MITYLTTYFFIVALSSAAPPLTPFVPQVVTFEGKAECERAKAAFTASASKLYEAHGCYEKYMPRSSAKVAPTV